MSEEASVSCPVCGAMNPPGESQCGACGFALPHAKSEDHFDALLEGLLDLSEAPPSEAAPGDTADDEPEVDDVDQEVAEQLFDSLLVEIQPSAPSETTEVRSRAALSVAGRAAAEDIADIERVPILATPEETEARTLTRVSGRMFDGVTFGTVGALVAVFMYFRMYANPLGGSELVSITLFGGVAVAGMAAGLALYHLSNSEVAQGDRLVKAGRYGEALAHYDRAIRMVRRPSYAWTSRGVAMKYLGRLEEALRCHENAIRLDPENEVAWCNLGTVYFKKGELGKSLECYDKAIKVRPRYAIAWNNKGAVLARMGRFEEADACHAKATKLRPEYVAAWLNRGEVLARLGARDEAQRCLEKARAISRSTSS